MPISGSSFGPNSNKFRIPAAGSSIQSCHPNENARSIAMSKMIRVSVAFLFVAGFVALGFQGNAWASRLEQAVPTASPAADQTGTLTDCAGGIVKVNSAAAGVVYRAYVVSPSELPAGVPNIPVTCAFKVKVVTSPNLGSNTQVCWPILTTQAGSAYYHNGSQWVELPAQTTANQLCLDYVPGAAPNPVYVAVVSKEPTGPQIPVTGGGAILSSSGSRGDGTVKFNSQGQAVIPVTGQTSAVGSCTWVFSSVEAPPANVNYKVQFVPETALPGKFPGLLVSCPVKVDAITSTNLGSKTLVCWPLVPRKAGVAYYYDGSQWVKTTNSLINDDQVCADVVAASAPNPAFVAVFDK